VALFSPRTTNSGTLDCKRAPRGGQSRTGDYLDGFHACAAIGRRNQGPEDAREPLQTRDYVVAVRYARPGYAEQVALEPEKLAWFRTIEDLFALVATAQESAATVRVSYDAQRGFPRSVYIDYVTDLVGDEVELAVTSFVAED